MEKIIIAYSTDIKNSRVFLKFKRESIDTYPLNEKNFSHFFISNLTEENENPFTQILFLISIDFYLANRDTFNDIYEGKGNRDCNFFIVIGTEDSKKISKINLQTSFTLIPDKKLHEIFCKIPVSSTVELGQVIHSKKEDFSKKILEIATILGSERNIETLMNRILTSCMEIVDADAGSLAILGFDKQLRDTDKDILTFYVSKNNSKEIHFNRFSMKIDLNSLAGYSIIKKKILNIQDAYKIPKKEQYHFNKSFDKQTGFKTKSILVVPMIDPRENIMGVIQLLNKKKGGYSEVIDYDTFIPSEIEEFNYTDQQTVLSLTNLASVLLKNQLLYNQVNDLLKNFVKASVYAVEQRDPTTSGHSERVATYSVALAQTASNTKGVMENYHFDFQQIQELRYAALLHDFGKIAVREKTLVKANKLEDYELENIFKKIRIYLLNFQLAAEQQKIILLNSKDLHPDVVTEQIKKIDQQVAEEIEKVGKYKQIITKSNIPMIIEEEASKVLEKIHKIKFFDNGEEQRILTNDEFRFLNIKKGSLSEEERLQIESHVTQSFYFLQQINWIPGLKNVPEIAYGHHEKLDGHGYPRRLKAHQIMPQTKIMTVCDIYDALTASDRPYKKSLSPEKSISILYDEVTQNKIDGELVDLFVKKKVYLQKPEPFDNRPQN